MGLVLTQIFVQATSTKFHHVLRVKGKAGHPIPVDTGQTSNRKVNMSHEKPPWLYGVTLVRKGYNTGVVDADKHCDAPHDAGPLPLELMWLSQMAIEAGIQQADNSCEKEQADPNYTR